MNILNNFVNPWESGGAFGSQALGTEVLEGNVLASNDFIKNINQQEIIPSAYLFAHDNDDVDNTELNRIKIEIVLIYKKNNLKIDVQIVSKDFIKNKEKDGFKSYELAVGVIFRSNSGNQTKGFSDFYTSGNCLTDKLLIYTDDILRTFVTYEHALKNATILYYEVGFYAAHELLHQMIIKACCHFYHGFKHPKTKYETMVFDVETFEIHANDEPNLNLDGELFSKFGISDPQYRPASKKPSNIEKILQKHYDLITIWLSPNSYNMPPSPELFLNELWWENNNNK